jgi:hypothetical protein
VALVAALTLPLSVAVFGLLVLGVPHVVLEVRYVLGRHRDLLQGRFLLVVNVLLVVLVVTRLLWREPAGRRAEVLVLVGLLALVLAFGRWPPRTLAVGAVAVAAVGVLTWVRVEDWFVVQTHLHNLVPVVFLWSWSAETLAPAARVRFRAATLAWALVVPALVLVGAFDPLQATTPAAPGTGGLETAGVLRSVAPGGATDTLALRLLTLFAFGQLMHYAVWCWLLPRHAPGATAAFDATPAGRAVRGWRLPALTVGLLAVVAAVAVVDYADGRTVYSSLGVYHATLEYPILLALALLLVTRRRSTRSTHSSGAAP